MYRNDIMRTATWNHRNHRSIGHNSKTDKDPPRLHTWRMVRDLFAFTPSGIMSRMSCITAARSSRSKWDSTLCFVTDFAIPFECLFSHENDRSQEEEEKEEGEKFRLRIPTRTPWAVRHRRQDTRWTPRRTPSTKPAHEKAHCPHITLPSTPTEQAPFTLSLTS